MDTPPRLLTSQVAKVLNVHKRTLIRLVTAGQVPAPPRGENNYYLWSESDIALARAALKGRSDG